MTKSISYEQIEAAISEIEELKPDEIIDRHTNIIEGMLKDEYSEEKVWRHCEVELESIDDTFKENLERENKLKEMLSRDTLSMKSRKFLNEIWNINNKQKNDLKLLRKSFKHFQIQYCKSIQPKAINDYQTDDESNALEEKIKEWIEKNIPNSSNKNHYLKAFKIVLSLKDPDNMKPVDVAKEVFARFEPNFKYQMFRKRVKPFLNSFDRSE